MDEAVEGPAQFLMETLTSKVVSGAVEEPAAPVQAIAPTRTRTNEESACSGYAPDHTAARGPRLTPPPVRGAGLPDHMRDGAYTEEFDRTGRRRGSLTDCMVAGTAIRCSATLATANVRDFGRFLSAGLSLVQG